CLISYFFFQAEDGIRDRNVTGVQTCALPISVVAHPAGHRHPVADGHRHGMGGRAHEDAVAGGAVAVAAGLLHEEAAQPRLEVGGHDTARGHADPQHRGNEGRTLDRADVDGLGPRDARREQEKDGREEEEGRARPAHHKEVYTQREAPRSGAPPAFHPKGEPMIRFRHRTGRMLVLAVTTMTAALPLTASPQAATARPATPQHDSAPKPATTPAAELVDINTASVEQLMAL